MNTPDVEVRRMMVETIINLAANSQANFSLVNVHEGDANTTVDFDLYYPYRGIDRDNVKRVRIDIKTEAE